MTRYLSLVTTYAWLSVMAAWADPVDEPHVPRQELHDPCVRSVVVSSHSSAPQKTSTRWNLPENILDLNYLDKYLTQRFSEGTIPLKYFVFKKDDQFVCLAFSDKGYHRELFPALMSHNPRMSLVAASKFTVEVSFRRNGQVLKLSVNGKADVAEEISSAELKAKLWEEIRKSLGSRLDERAQIVDELRAAKTSR